MKAFTLVCARGAAAAALAFSTLAFSTAALAHHAITLNYDPTSSGSVEGVVEEMAWANPHVHIYIRTETDGKLWDVESGNLNVMRTRGVSRNAIKIGDRVRVTGIVGRDGAAAMLSDSLVMVDTGAVLWGNPEVAPVAENYGQDND